MISRFVLDGETIVVSGNTKAEFAKDFVDKMTDRQMAGEQSYPEGLSIEKNAVELKEYAEALWDEAPENSTQEEGSDGTTTVTATGEGEVTLSIVSQKKGSTGA